MKTVILSFFLCVLTACSPLSPHGGRAEISEPNPEHLWKAAMADAVFSEDSEIKPLVCLTQDDPNVIWNREKNAVLLATFHKHSPNYKENRGFPEEEKEIWAVSAAELQKWLEKNKSKVSALRFAQVLGLPADCGFDTFTVFWIHPQNVIRPAYITDTAKQMKNGMEHMQNSPYKEWFEQNILFSYFWAQYPWTRLGYTYDWGNPEQEYGLTEFLIQNPQSAVIVRSFTLTEFICLTEKF